jgi:hypothetical protein
MWIAHADLLGIGAATGSMCDAAGCRRCHGVSSGLPLWVMEAVVMCPRSMTGRFCDRRPGFARRPQDQPHARGRHPQHAPAAAGRRKSGARWCARKRRAAPQLRSWLSAVARTHSKNRTRRVSGSSIGTCWHFLTQLGRNAVTPRMAALRWRVECSYDRSTGPATGGQVSLDGRSGDKC